MSSWIAVPCLAALRDEFNRVSPNRDKGADGTIGDTSHTSSSDHTPDEDSTVLKDKDSDTINEVHALDVDSTGPWPDENWFNNAIVGVVNNHKAGRDNRLQNVIWNRKIASRSWGWTWQDYTGSPDPHINHAHFSARYGSGSGSSNPEVDVSPWGVEVTQLTDDDADVIINRMATRLRSQSSMSSPTDTFVAAFRAVPWQYQGGGLPTGASSTLGAMALIGNAATALTSAVSAVMANVTADDNEKAQLLADAQAKFDALGASISAARADVHAVPDELLAKLGGAGVSATQAAEAIRELLGTNERIAAVKALL